MRSATIRTIRLTGLAAILLLNFSGLAVAHLGETPDQVKERLGKPTEILGSDGVPVPAPATSRTSISFQDTCLASTSRTEPVAKLESSAIRAVAPSPWRRLRQISRRQPGLPAKDAIRLMKMT